MQGMRSGKPEATNVIVRKLGGPPCCHKLGAAEHNLIPGFTK